MHKRTLDTAAMQEVDEEIQHLRMQNRGCLEVFSGRRGSSQYEYPRSNNGPYSQCSDGPWAESLSQTILWFIRLGNQLVDGLTPQKLAAQKEWARFSWLRDDKRLAHGMRDSLSQKELNSLN